MAAPTVQEAQRGVYAAAVIRVLFIPAMVVIPGIVAFKLYGDIGDQAYGRVVIVGDLLQEAQLAAVIRVDNMACLQLRLPLRY